MNNYTHITIFDREYPMDKQAEGMAVSRAVAEGACDKCGFLKSCSTVDSFKPPVFAWCSQRKNEILANLQKEGE